MGFWHSRSRSPRGQRPRQVTSPFPVRFWSATAPPLVAGGGRAAGGPGGLARCAEAARGTAFRPPRADNWQCVVNAGQRRSTPVNAAARGGCGPGSGPGHPRGRPCTPWWAGGPPGGVLGGSPPTALTALGRPHNHFFGWSGASTLLARKTDRFVDRPHGHPQHPPDAPVALYATSPVL